MAVEPVPPSATSRVAEANPTPETGSCDGATSVAVSPLSVVRTIWLDPDAMTQVVLEAHVTWERFCDGMPASAFGFHVSPPSSVARKSEPSPTAMPLAASNIRKRRTWRWVSLTAVQEFAPSAVR